MSDESKRDAAADTTAASEKIVGEGEDVRERIRRLVVDTVRGRKLGLDQLAKISQEVLDGAVAAVDRAVPAKAESTLRQVFDGVEDAFTTAANATRLALEEAAARGETLARDDLEKTVKDLGALERMFTDTVSDAARRSSRQAADQLKSFLTHVQRTGSSIRPSVDAALTAARRHPLTLTREAAAASLEATRQTAGFLMHAMSGFLHAAGDLLAGEGREKGEAPRGGEHGESRGD